MQQTMAPMRRNRRPVPGAASFDQSNPFIYLGTIAGVKKARARTGALVAPLDADPELFAWPVQGLWVLLVSEPDCKELAARLAGILLREGAERVIVVGEGNSRTHRAIAPTVPLIAKRRATVLDAPNFD